MWPLCKETRHICKSEGVKTAQRWLCKRTPRHIGEYLECPGEAGHREENGIVRLYREVSPNGIREASGNDAYVSGEHSSDGSRTNAATGPVYNEDLTRESVAHYCCPSGSMCCNVQSPQCDVAPILQSHSKSE